MVEKARALLVDGTRWNARQLRLDRNPKPDKEVEGWSELESDPKAVPLEPKIADRKTERLAIQRPVRLHKHPKYLSDYEVVVKG